MMVYNFEKCAKTKNVRIEVFWVANLENELGYVQKYWEKQLNFKSSGENRYEQHIIMMLCLLSGNKTFTYIVFNSVNILKSS